MDDEFWKLKSDLKQQIIERLQIIDGTDLAHTCVDSFFQLEGAKSWKPEKVLRDEISYVIDIGLVLTILGFDNLTDDYRQKINKTIEIGSDLSANLLSELLVAVLLKHYGASVQFIPRRSSSKTADLSCSWENQNPFDVEVTRAEIRPLHAAVQRAGNAFIDALHPGDVDWHVACFVSDASDPKILDAAFDAAVKLLPGQRAEEEGMWFVTAIPLSERDSTVNRFSKLLKPTWWPQGESTFFFQESLLNGKGNPVVMLRSLAPKASYMNPVIRKANSGQYTKKRSYLIALNTSELPDAYERLPPDIEQNFPIWNHVSGILIFNPLFYFKSKTLKFRLLVNRNSCWPLPSQLLDLAKDSLLEFPICHK